MINIKDLMGKFAISIRKEVVRLLLAGNDTGCFTTEQYRAAYHKHRQGSSYIYADHDLARMHLLDLPDLVNEVKPNVWTSCET